MIDESNNLSAIDSIDVIEQGSDQATQQEAPPAQLVEHQPQPQGYQAKNFAELRDARERAERERDELRYRLQQIEMSKNQESIKEDFNITGNDDDLVEVKHLKAIAKRQKEFESQVKQYQQQYTQMTAEARLKSSYSDLEKVVTEDNIRKLKDQDPDLVASLQCNPDTYSRYSAAYKAIKRLGIYQEDSFEQDKQKAQYNANKPRPLTSVSPQQGQGPLSRVNAFANGLTPELKAQLIKEMQDARKKY